MFVITKNFQKAGDNFSTIEEAETALKNDIPEIDTIVNLIKQSFIDGYTLQRNLTLKNNDTLVIEVVFANEESANAHFNSLPQDTEEILQSKGWKITKSSGT